MKDSQRGFTIVELLIVLAIAGMILISVLLIIPVAARNSRNNQRRDDVSLLLQATNKYQSDHLGGFMPPCNGSSCASCLPSGSNFLCGNTPRFYDVSNIKVVTNSNAYTGPTIRASNPDSLIISNFLRCDGNDPSSTNAAPRDVVAIFKVEDSGTGIPQCIQL